MALEGPIRWVNSSGTLFSLRRRKRGLERPREWARGGGQMFCEPCSGPCLCPVSTRGCPASLRRQRTQSHPTLRGTWDDHSWGKNNHQSSI